jgi:hypothetical protein
MPNQSSNKAQHPTTANPSAVAVPPNSAAAMPPKNVLADAPTAIATPSAPRRDRGNDALRQQDRRRNDEGGEFGPPARHLPREARSHCRACREEQHDTGGEDHQPPIQEEALQPFPRDLGVFVARLRGWLTAVSGADERE